MKSLYPSNVMLQSVYIVTLWISFCGKMCFLYLRQRKRLSLTLTSFHFHFYFFHPLIIHLFLISSTSLHSPFPFHSLLLHVSLPPFRPPASFQPRVHPRVSDFMGSTSGCAASPPLCAASSPSPARRGRRRAVRAMNSLRRSSSSRWTFQKKIIYWLRPWN